MSVVELTSQSLHRAVGVGHIAYHVVFLFLFFLNTRETHGSIRNIGNIRGTEKRVKNGIRPLPHRKKNTLKF